MKLPRTDNTGERRRGGRRPGWAWEAPARYPGAEGRGGGGAVLHLPPVSSLPPLGRLAVGLLPAGFSWFEFFFPASLRSLSVRAWLRGAEPGAPGEGRAGLGSPGLPRRPAGHPAATLKQAPESSAPFPPRSPRGRLVSLFCQPTAASDRRCFACAVFYLLCEAAVDLGASCVVSLAEQGSDIGISG